MTAPPAPPFVDPPAFSPPPPPPPPPGPPVRGQLQRSRTDKVLGGVSGGLAHYSGIDALLWRVGFVALAFAGGTGVLVYLLLWLLMPAAPGVPLGDDAARVPAGPRSPVPGLTIAVLLIVVGALALLARVTDWSPGPQVFVAAALLVVGLGLVAAAFTGGRTAKGGLITLGVVLSLATLIASAAPWDDIRRDGVGDRSWAPATAAEVRETYRSGVGNTEVDLSGIDVSNLDQPIRTRLEHGIGRVEVLVPEDADVRVIALSGIGHVDLFGDANTDGGVYPGEGSGRWVGDGDPEIVLDIDNGIGEVAVSRG